MWWLVMLQHGWYTGGSVPQDCDTDIWLTLSRHWTDRLPSTAQFGHHRYFWRRRRENSSNLAFRAEDFINRTAFSRGYVVLSTETASTAAPIDAPAVEMNLTLIPGSLLETSCICPTPVFEKS